jgi:hypothetical protein
MRVLGIPDYIVVLKEETTTYNKLSANQQKRRWSLFVYYVNMFVRYQLTNQQE